jgi:hypothetical protein
MKHLDVTCAKWKNNNKIKIVKCGLHSLPQVSLARLHPCISTPGQINPPHRTPSVSDHGLDPARATLTQPHPAESAS